MKTVITIEDGRITVSVDDQAPVVHESASPSLPILESHYGIGGSIRSEAAVDTAPKDLPEDEREEPANKTVLPPATRTCAECGAGIDHLSKRSTICGSDKCKKAKAARYQREYFAKSKPQTVKPSLMPQDDPPTKVEGAQYIESVKPGIAPLMTHHANGTFLDPWDCQMCRNGGVVCDFHRRMTISGTRPPIGKGVV